MGNSDIPLRRSPRLKAYDYTQVGAYFVTLVTHDRDLLLGDVVKGEVKLTHIGKVVADTWLWLPTQYPCVELDEFVVMPNHLHGVIWLAGPLSGTGDSRIAPTNFGGKSRWAG